MAVTSRFSADALAWLGETKYVKVRAGATHRLIHIWVVVVDGHVFARSWNNKPDGWYAAFLKEPEGALEVDGKAMPVRARKVTAADFLNAATKAYGAKYSTKPNEKYVVGFAEPHRRKNTVELLPT
ncbi:MAG TPA: DUF2255 family protein [Candidatus Thermoplasmatota archaeon]